MICPRPSDLLQTGAARAAGLRFVYVDVTDSARDLARSHLSGPAAALALSESLAGVAILGADLELPEETVSFHLQTNGPIGIVLVEASFDGALRGFTGKKILNDFDGVPEPDLQAVFGKMGEFRVMRSVPGHIISQSSLQLPNPRPAEALTAYYNAGLQRKAVVSIVAVPGNDGPDLVRGFLLELMPDGNKSVYEDISAQLKGESFSDSLEGARGFSSLCEELGLADAGLVLDDARPLRFGCRCTRERARETLQTISSDELRTMARSGKTTDIYCHMCGKCYSFQPDDLIRIADQR